MCAWNGSTNNGHEFAETTMEFERAFAIKASDETHTRGAIHARIAGAIIDDGFAIDTRIPDRTDATIGIDHINTRPIVLAGENDRDRDRERKTNKQTINVGDRRDDIYKSYQGCDAHSSISVWHCKPL
jgi:hypothetical protein